MATDGFTPSRTELSQTPLQVDEPVFDLLQQRGTIKEVLQHTNVQLTQVLVETDQGAQYLLPATILQRDENDVLRLPLRFDQVVVQSTDGDNPDEVRIVLPVLEETLDIAKRERVTGRVRITKSVDEHEAVVDDTLAGEEITVERVPINRVVETPAKQRYEGETLIIPIHREVLVVEKQLMLVEELHINKEQKEELVHRTVTLRREDVTVERIAGTQADNAE